MPYYWRPYRPYRRRWRRTWRRRTRASFRRRRLWRPRRYRVRKYRKKLKKITVKQWQPSTIRKLIIKGQYPLFSGTTERIGNDNTAYIDQIAPHDYPGGGLYSITVFTLQGLYELHQKGRNWWTKSNCNLPLIRYQGCSVKLYNSSSVDYVTVAVNCGELKATEKMFQSTQPSVLMLNRKKKVLQCKNFKRNRRGYKKMFIPPPALLYNKWYFQKELANYPLVMFLSAAMSLDRYYLSASSVSETMGFTSLNTDFFKLHNWKAQTPNPYKPQEELYILTTGTVTKQWTETPLKNMILCGNTLEHTLGLTFDEVQKVTPGTGTASNWDTVVQTYLSKKSNWANPFHQLILSHEEEGMVCLLKVPSTNTIAGVLKSLDPNKKGKEQTAGHLISPTKPFTVACRYNPQPDLGHNATFVASITTDNTPWHEPSDQHKITQGFPLWLLLWGWHDYLAKSQIPLRLDTDYTQIIVSDYISPKSMTYYLPLDWFFLNGRSPYAEEGHIKPYDQQNWHPKINFQTQSISHILQSGPATAKLPPMISAEAHMTYKFHFKVGGCPPSMDEVCNPDTQPEYPQPGNHISSILLQNPETPLQYYINAFDQRREMLTERAAKRIKKDSETKETFSKPAGRTLLEIQAPSPETTSTEDSSEEEESEDQTQTLIHRHQRKQRKLQQRILQLLRLVQSTK
nr:MAG: ORF1 [TTV-like mini virus]